MLWREAMRKAIPYLIGIAVLATPITAHANWLKKLRSAVKGATQTVLTIPLAPADVVRGQPIGTHAERITRESFEEVAELSEGAREELDDTGRAILNYAEASLKGIPDNLSDADRRLKEGRVIDAVFGIGTGQLKVQNDALAEAAATSDFLNQVAQTAATAYGGPSGAAAYAAWYTYNQTGNVETSLKAAALAAAVDQGMSEVQQIRAAPYSVKKAAAGGAIGGLAVAMAGGSEDQVLQGFMLGSGKVLIQDAYVDYTGSPLKAEASNDETPYCMASIGASCYAESIRETDPAISHIGTAAKESDGGVLGITERHESMIVLSKAPGMNAMSFAHDAAMEDMALKIGSDVDLLTKAGTIPPFVAITYVATGAAVQTYITDTVRSNAPSSSSASRKSTSTFRGGEVSRKVRYAFEGNPAKIDLDVFACNESAQNEENALLVTGALSLLERGRLRLRWGNIIGRSAFPANINIYTDMGHPERPYAEKFRDYLQAKFPEKTVQIVANPGSQSRWYLSIGVCGNA